MSKADLFTGSFRWLAFQACPEYRSWLRAGPRNGLAVNYAHRGRVVFAFPGAPPVMSPAPVAWFTEPALVYGYGLRPQDPGWWEHRYVVFSGGPRELWLRQKMWPTLEEPHSFPISKANEVKDAFDALLWYLGHEPDRHRAPEALVELLAILRRERLSRRAFARGKTRIEQFAAALEKSVPEPLPLKEIAHRHGYTPEAASLAFFRRFGVRPTAWREAKRMERACELLRHGGMTVREIASRCGYVDPYAFSKSFKRWSGKAPSHWAVP